MRLTRDILLDEERRMLSQSVAGFREQVLADRARDMDEEVTSGVVEDTFKGAASLGLAAALVSEEAGGQGMDSFSFCLAIEEVAQGSAGFAAILLGHNLALWVLERAGALPGEAGLITGEQWAAMGWPLDIEAVDANAPFVPGGTGASVFACVSPAGEVYGAAREDSLEVREVERPMGWRASRPASLKLDLSTAHPAATLDEAGLRELESRVLVGLGSIALGISRHAFEKAQAYASERWQACDYIINHQQIRLMLGGMLAGIETGEAALKQMAWCIEGSLGTIRAHRAFKIQACDNAMQSALDGVQIHGGYGYMRDYGMELLMRDAKTCQVYPRSPQEEMLSLLD